jgi:hypothetical protein
MVVPGGTTCRSPRRPCSCSWPARLRACPPPSPFAARERGEREREKREREKRERERFLARCLTAGWLLQVLRLAEAHIKHEKEELKSLNVVLGRNSE